MKNTKKTEVDQGKRSFLKLAGLACLGTVGTAAAALLPSIKDETSLFSAKEYKVSSTRLAMGTFVTMTAIHTSRDEAENAIGPRL